MLTTLFLSNFLLVKQTTIDFKSGISVLTGETGAGKSILINALSLVLGARGSGNWIGQYSDNTEIVAQFNSVNKTVLKTLQSLAIFSDDVVILRRILYKNGKTRAFVNDTTVSVKTLNLIGEQLVDIYGQHSHYALLKPETQREKLDSFGDYKNELSLLKTSFEQHSAFVKRYEVLKNNQQTDQNRFELLNYQLEEFSELNIRDGEFAELEILQNQLSQANFAQNSLNSAIEQLHSSDSSVVSIVESIQQNITQYNETYPEFKPVSDILEENAIQLGDVVNDIRNLLNKIEIDPEKLTETEQRIGQLFDLSRKHNCKPDELLTIEQQLRAECDVIQNSNTSFVELEQKIVESKQTLTKYADIISQKRQVFAKKLSNLVSDQIQSLGMLGASFEIELNRLDNDKITQYGQEQINFTIETNIGCGFDDLSASASGGELSRLGLAIQVSAANKPEVSTLVMDEIDAGIGGETANMVGKLLKKLSKNAQILCVTHLPQIASIGDVNIKISKEIIDGNTSHFVNVLGQQQRIKEIARMLDGDNISEQSLKHAEEILRKS